MWFGGSLRGQWHVPLLQWFAVQFDGAVLFELLRRRLLLWQHLHEHMLRVQCDQKGTRIGWRVRADRQQQRPRQRVQSRGMQWIGLMQSAANSAGQWFGVHHSREMGVGSLRGRVLLRHGVHGIVPSVQRRQKRKRDERTVRQHHRGNRSGQ